MSIAIVFGGGQDNEEAAARVAAEKAGCITATATIGGVKVHAGNAYKADGFVVDKGNIALIKKIVIFECSPATAGDLEVVAICDHHNPGDHGYEKGADQYWEASSLGQLCYLLDIERTHELELVSAGDHCPADAYAGRCQGVHPEEFLDFRISQKVGFYANHPKLPSKTVEEIRIAIKAAQKNCLPQKW